MLVGLQILMTVIAFALGDLLLIEDPVLSADLFEGDIAGIDAKNKLASADRVKFWSNGLIPYKIGEEINFTAKRAIKKAINRIQAISCVKFIPALTETKNYVNFQSSFGCYSEIGEKEGPQLVSVGPGCDHVGIVLHELMHVLGFWHENSRLDRDDFVMINWDNVQSDDEGNFEKYSSPKVASVLQPYDVDSITHLSSFAFAKNSSTPTILSKDERKFVGQRYDLSQGDINKINNAYCSENNGIDAVDGPATPHESNEFQQSQPRTTTEVPSVSNCVDKSDKCRLWASQGQCYRNERQMRETCPATCLVCRGHKLPCRNSKSLCGLWAWLGQCTRGLRGTWMVENCPLACRICLPEGVENEIRENQAGARNCKNFHSDCERWATKGRCFYRFVSDMCPVSCNKCEVTTGITENFNDQTNFVTNPGGECNDYDPKCSKWAAKGYCERFRVMQKCLISCDLC